MAAQQQIQQQQVLQQLQPAAAYMPASADAWGSDTDDEDSIAYSILQLQHQDQVQHQVWQNQHSKQHQQRVASLLAQLPVRRQQQQHQHWQPIHTVSLIKQTSARTGSAAPPVAQLQHCQHAQQPAPGQLAQTHHQQQQQQQQQQPVPQLQALCLAVLGGHIRQLAEQLGGQPGSLYWLPAEMKAALLAVAR
jgi:hypothetical protein